MPKTYITNHIIVQTPMTALVSVIPILLLIVLMMGFKVSGYRSAIVTLVVTILLALFAAPAMGIVPEKYMGLYMLNPMTPIINCFRKAFLGLGSFDLFHYLISWGVTLVVLFIGLMMFNKVEKTFMDTV